MSIPIRIRSAFSPSEALDRHVERCVETAGRSHSRHIRHVDVHLSDDNGPRRGPDDKVAVIEIALHPFGEIVTRAKSSDAYESVRKAASTAKRTLARQAARLVKRRPGGEPLEAA